MEIEFEAIENSVGQAPANVDCWTCIQRTDNHYWDAGYCELWNFLIGYPPRKIHGFNFDDPDNPKIIQDEPVIDSYVGCSEWKLATRRLRLAKAICRELDFAVGFVQEFLGWIRSNLRKLAAKEEGNG